MVPLAHLFEEHFAGPLAVALRLSWNGERSL